MVFLSFKFILICFPCTHRTADSIQGTLCKCLQLQESHQGKKHRDPHTATGVLRGARRWIEKKLKENWRNDSEMKRVKHVKLIFQTSASFISIFSESLAEQLFSFDNDSSPLKTRVSLFKMRCFMHDTKNRNEKSEGIPQVPPNIRTMKGLQKIEASCNLPGIDALRIARGRDLLQCLHRAMNQNEMVNREGFISNIMRVVRVFCMDKIACTMFHTLLTVHIQYPYLC